MSNFSNAYRFASGNFSGENITIDMDDLDRMAEFKDIPDTFIGIRPEKYPLIITFHKFLMMLDGTLGHSYFERFHEVKGSSRHEAGRSVALQTFIRKNEVTYDRFCSSYWPHFNAKLTKSLDPSRVFTEIMSHIKGGLQAGEACDSKRSRKDYISLSDSRVSTLSADERERIYDIFQDYEKMKPERGQFDLSDLVIDIHSRLQNEEFPGDRSDFVYIDEVQDLNMRQIALFRYICKNVDEGFVFSGDTAQTIARGIDFRFEDIRALFYNEFLMKSENCDFSGSGKGLISDTFNLSQNFRTHTGVLRLAQSVIDLISHFFPQSIDVLAPETSFIYGESPVVLEPGSDENAILTIFGSSGNAGGKWIGFGADQVILVRDDSAREEILSSIGHQALVLTIVECKGLEFQDVLLYNFFGSSPMSNQWRVVYEFLKENDILDANSPKSFPSFNLSRHNILCSELKQLYVAITRTRQRLWICENNEELSRPMFDYWTRLCLVQVRKIDESLAAAMQRSSSPEEWKSQGIKLFWEKNYEMASMCFERAGDLKWEKRAKASGLRASADHVRPSNSEEARKMLTEAAEIFYSIDIAESAAECFCDLGDYGRAGKIYLENLSELRKAGECFSLAGRYELAADVYAKGNLFRECLEVCMKGGYFDMGIHYIKQWRQLASLNNGSVTNSGEVDKIGQEFLERCAMESYRTKDNASLLKFVRAFHTMEAKRNFLESLECHEELLILEEESGNFTEAVEIAKKLGNHLLEVDLLVKAEKLADASLLILSYVLSNSLWVTGGQGWPLKSFPNKDEVLRKAVSHAQKVSESFHDSVSTEAKILSNAKGKLSELMQGYNTSKECGTYVGEILSLRKLLDAHLQVRTTDYVWELDLHIEPKSSDDRILRNDVAAGTLVDVWNLWKEKSLEILDCLDSLGQMDLIKCEGATGFCFRYFGVRLSHNLSSICLLMNPNAAWLKNVDKRFVVRTKKVMTLEIRHFAAAAKKYWWQEIVSVGLRVLYTLEALHKSSVVKNLSIYCQSMCLTWIFDIAKFFIESKSFDGIRQVDARKLQDSLRVSSRYFGNVFTLDPRQSLSQNMISLRETEVSRNLLEEVICRNISTEDELTYAQIGRVVMILLGSGKLKTELYNRIAAKFVGNQVWDGTLRGIIELYSSKSMQESPFIGSIEALSKKLYKALETTYKAKWRSPDYISPNCFLYIVERLLILVPHSQGFFYTTKSSLVEYLVSLHSDANPSVALLTKKQSFARSITDFVARVVHELIYNNQDTAEWIARSKIDCKFYFPVMMLRLFMILCVLCLNSELPVDVLFKVMNVIRSQLPREFCEAVCCGKEYDNSYVAAIAGAFKIIGDPVVIVASTANNPKFECPDAFFLNLSSSSCKSEIMRVLFPSSTIAGRQLTKSGTGLSPIEENVTSNTDPIMSTETGKWNLQINWRLFQEIPNLLESARIRNDGSLKSLVIEKKAEVEEHLNLFAAAVVLLSQEQRSQSSEDNSTLLDVLTNMIVGFQRISSLLETSDFADKDLSEIGEIVKSLEEKRPQLDILCRLFAEQKHTEESSVPEGMSGKEIDDGEDLVVAANEQMSNQAATSASESSNTRGKGKNKKTNKSKKGGKGGRKR